MNAFLVFHSTITDPAKFQAYARAIGPTLTPFDGAVVRKGTVARVLEGDHAHRTIGILAFPDLGAALGWYDSPAYRALVPMRDAAAELTVIGYEEPPP